MEETEAKRNSPDDDDDDNGDEMENRTKMREEKQEKIKFDQRYQLHGKFEPERLTAIQSVISGLHGDVNEYNMPRPPVWSHHSQ